MESASVFAHSKVTPSCLTLNNNGHSLRPFNKHLVCNGFLKSRIKIPLKSSFSSKSSRRNPLHCDQLLSCLSSTRNRTHVFRFRPIKCSFSSSTSVDSENPILNFFKNLSLDSLKSSLARLTPIDICKLALVFSVSIAASQWVFNLLFSPFFWMYFSWTWLFWPWYIAIAIAIYGFYCLRKHMRDEANLFEQFAIITSAFTWLTLVPPAHFNGFLEGWPWVFFFVYHFFFLLNSTVRKRMYGDYKPRQHDPKWDIATPNSHRVLYCVAVMVGHWLAAFEGPELHTIPGGKANLVIWVLIMGAMTMQYHSTLYLAKYSEKVVVPTAVVQFGPYRWVRHPIYASTMLLFVTYFAALRAPMSGLFIVVASLLYYREKAKLEEEVMMEVFKEKYIEYMDRVKYKLIPFVY